MKRRPQRSTLELLCILSLIHDFLNSTIIPFLGLFGSTFSPFSGLFVSLHLTVGSILDFLNSTFSPYLGLFGSTLRFLHLTVGVLHCLFCFLLSFPLCFCRFLCFSICFYPGLFFCFQ